MDISIQTTNIEYKILENIKLFYINNNFFTLCKNTIKQNNKISDMGLVTTIKNKNQILSYKSDFAGDDQKKIIYLKKDISNKNYIIKM